MAITHSIRCRSLFKGGVFFVAGVFLARQISEEWVADAAAGAVTET